MAYKTATETIINLQNIVSILTLLETGLQEKKVCSHVYCVCVSILTLLETGLQVPKERACFQ